jgi:uncharacterized protein YjbI with pentapeptide repeats
MRSTRVERKKPGQKSKAGLKKESGRWRPTTRQVFWAIGVVVTLMTIALLVVRLYPGLWEDVAREPVAMLKGRVATLIGIGVALTVLIVLLAKGSASLGWTGGFRGKTVWDLLQLLIVPLALAGIGFWFAAQQDARQQQIENQRAKAERELAEQRAQDEALQAYLDQMNNLPLEHNLRNSKEDSGVRTLARARTLTVLKRLDPSGKTAVMQFLVEAELVQRVEGGRGPIITLLAADLSDANLSGGADLNNAILNNANLSNADLRYDDLSEADLRYADLRGANLSSANLSSADLGTNLGIADLSNADLSNANLSNADLTQVDLSDANLSGTKGWTEDQLSKARTLEGAAMPDGQRLKSDDNPDGPTFEDWLRELEYLPRMATRRNISSVT